MPADLPVTLVLPKNFLLTDGPVGSRAPDTAAIDRIVADLADYMSQKLDEARSEVAEDTGAVTGFEVPDLMVQAGVG